jgi:hypothetical protein
MVAPAATARPCTSVRRETAPAGSCRCSGSRCSRVSSSSLCAPALIRLATEVNEPLQVARIAFQSCRTRSNARWLYLVEPMWGRLPTAPMARSARSGRGRSCTKREITTPAPTADILISRGTSPFRYRNSAGPTAALAVRQTPRYRARLWAQADEGREIERPGAGKPEWPPEGTHELLRKEDSTRISLPISATKMIARLSSVPLLARLHWRPPAR